MFSKPPHSIKVTIHRTTYFLVTSKMMMMMIIIIYLSQMYSLCKGVPDFPFITWHNISILLYPWHPKTSIQLNKTLSPSLFSSPTLVFLFLYCLSTINPLLVSNAYYHSFSKNDSTISGFPASHTLKIYALTLQSVHSGQKRWKCWKPGKLAFFRILLEKLENHRFFSCFG